MILFSCHTKEASPIWKIILGGVGCFGMSSFALYFCLSITTVFSFLPFQDLQVKSSPPVQSNAPINSDPAIIQASYLVLSMDSYVRANIYI